MNNFRSAWVEGHPLQGGQPDYLLTVTSSYVIETIASSTILFPTTSYTLIFSDLPLTCTGSHSITSKSSLTARYVISLIRMQLGFPFVRDSIREDTFTVSPIA